MIWNYLKRRNASERRVQRTCELTDFHPFFIERIADLVKIENQLEKVKGRIPKHALVNAKRNGFSDLHISNLTSKKEKTIRNQRKKIGLSSSFLMVDTCAGEFEAKTPYFYSTYSDEKTEYNVGKNIVILGSGPI